MWIDPENFLNYVVFHNLNGNFKTNHSDVASLSLLHGFSNCCAIIQFIRLVVRSFFCSLGFIFRSLCFCFAVSRMIHFSVFCSLPFFWRISRCINVCIFPLWLCLFSSFSLSMCNIHPLLCAPIVPIWSLWIKQQFENDLMRFHCFCFRKWFIIHRKTVALL